MLEVTIHEHLNEIWDLITKGENKSVRNPESYRFLKSIYKIATL